MDRYRQIVELSDDCIKEINLDGVVVGVNGKGLKLLRAEHPSQVIDRPWRDLWPAESRALVDAAVEAARDGIQSEFDASCPGFDGELRDWHVKVSPVSEDGVVTSLLAVSSDVTERNSAYAAADALKAVLGTGPRMVADDLVAAAQREAALKEDLRSSNSRLMATNIAYQELEVRHFELSQDRVFAIAAQRAAELIAQQAQKGEAVGQLLAGVVHDLNNFLQSATAAIDIVLDSDEIGSRNSNLLRVAELALQQGADMSRRLVGFAREYPYRPEAVELAELVEEMHPLLLHAVGSKASLVVDVGDPGCCALVDRNTLERALLNLVINARDACSSGDGIRIQTGRRVVESEDSTSERVAGEYVTLTVSDDGSGMTEEVISRLFEVYFTTKPAGQGSGLGLPQVHSAVRQAGGFVTIVSSAGEGSSFELALPRVST